MNWGCDVNAVIQFPTARIRTEPKEVRVADVENGYTRIANELYDAINLADLNRNELKVAHAIARATYGFNKRFDRISDNQIAARTGLSRQAVSYAKNSLLRMKVLVWEGNRIGVNRILFGWDISDCHRKSDTVRETMTKSVRETVTRLSGKVRHTKDIITKEKKKDPEGVSACAETPSAGVERKPVKHTPFKAIVDAYHELLPEMPGVRELTDSRKTKIRNFWHKFGFTEERWCKYLEYIAANCRWMCECRDRGNGQTWRPKNLDFLVTERCYLGVREGRFND